MNAKMAICLLSYFAGPRLLAVSGAACASAWLLTSQPLHGGGGHVEHLTPATLEAALASQAAASSAAAARKPKLAKVSEAGAKPEPVDALAVCFYASWHAPSAHWAPAFAALAAKHGGRKGGRPGGGLRFASLDLGEWPSAAKAHRIDMNATTAALPCCVLFEDGKAVARVPALRDETTSVVVSGRWTAANLETVFELPRRSAAAAAP